jgi:flagellar hook protein FlgE
MFSGVSGLRSHQTMMDVIGNNIANVNTAGFKSSQALFEDLLSQTIKGAGAPQQGLLGGTNPAQVGLGVRVAGITTSFSQGASQLTGRSTDLAIQGDGFFTLNQGGVPLYSRNGAFTFDGDGHLVSPDGGILQGWMANSAGVVDTNAPVTDLRIPPGQLVPPSRTNNVSLGGNLPSSPTGDPTTSITVYDTQGNSYPVTFTFHQTSANTWDLTAPGLTTSLTFDTSGARTSAQTVSWTPTMPGWTGGAVTVDLGAAGGPESLTQFAGQSTVSALKQDGAPSGSLQSFTVSNDGLLTGVFSNGLNKQLGRIAMAVFSNPQGLEKAGGSTFRETINSGLARVGSAGSGGRGMMSAGTLEMSNVDLAQEFTSLITAQRGFQANSRVITASDELLQDLVNLKR